MNERIEGVPVGTKATAHRIPLEGEWALGDCGIPFIQTRIIPIVHRLIIVPDNVYGVIDLSTFPIPAGVERTGDTVEQWFREPEGDSWLTSTGEVCSAYCPQGPDRRRICVRPIKPKTRRVLVETREFTITDRPCDSLTEVTPNTAGSLVSSQPHRYRIEERPL